MQDIYKTQDSMTLAYRCYGSTQDQLDYLMYLNVNRKNVFQDFELIKQQSKSANESSSLHKVTFFFLLPKNSMFK